MPDTLVAPLVLSLDDALDASAVGGKAAGLSRLIRLGVPVFPGSTLTYTGTVTGKSTADGDGLVDVAFRATNELGEHVSGTAVLGLPLRGAGR